MLWQPSGAQRSSSPHNAEGKQRAQDSVSMLKETVDEIGVHFTECTGTACHACCSKKTTEVWSAQWHQSCHDAYCIVDRHA